MKTLFVCILLLSLFALHQCTRITIRSKNLEQYSTCLPEDCDGAVEGGVCYCCPDTILCYDDQQYCDTHCDYA
ncbi:unnamed protein product [Cochlearia groenlandica]